MIDAHSHLGIVEEIYREEETTVMRLRTLPALAGN